MRARASQKSFMANHRWRWWSLGCVDGMARHMTGQISKLLSHGNLMKLVEKNVR